MQINKQMNKDKKRENIQILIHRQKYCVFITENNEFLCKTFLFKYITEIGKHSNLKPSINAKREFFNVGLKEIAKRATEIMKTDSTDRSPISKSEVRSILYSYRYIRITELYIMHYVIPYRIQYILEAIRKLSMKYSVNPLSFIPTEYLSINPSYVTFSIQQQFQSLQLLEINRQLNTKKLLVTYKAVLNHHEAHKIKQDFQAIGEDKFETTD